MDMGAIGAMVGSLNAARQITKAMLSIRDQAMIQSKVIELNTEILTAQSSAFAANATQTALLDQIRDLEKKIADLEAWEAEKKRYQLKDVGNGAMAFSLKPGMEESEPPHSICANCYSNGLKSILQKEIRYPGLAHVLACHSCGSDMYLSGHRHKDHTTTRRR